MRELDLHIHTTASDGTKRPAEVVQIAKCAGLRAIAVTDHDTMDGVERAQQEGVNLGIEVIRGVEISTKYGRSIHILGYFPHSDASAMKPLFDWMVADRDERNERVCQLMREDGLNVYYSEMKEHFGTSIGRPHFAELLVGMGFAGSIQDAFDKYVEKGRRYYVPRHFITIEESVESIRHAGGIPVLAHPFQYKMDDAGLRGLITHCMDHGLMGMECRYSGYTSEMSAYLESLRREYHLLETGGSDYHGDHKPHIALGRGISDNLEVPYEFLQELKEARP